MTDKPPIDETAKAEIEVMAKICELLNSLPKTAHVRVIKYLVSRYTGRWFI